MTDSQYQTLLDAIQHSAEETRRYVDESVRRSAEETRRYVDETVQRAVEENRRHFGVVAEGLRGQIQLLAESVAFLSDRIEAVRRELSAEIAEVRAEMRFYFGQLDRRVTALEGLIGT